MSLQQSGQEVESGKALSILTFECFAILAQIPEMRNCFPIPDLFVCSKRNVQRENIELTLLPFPFFLFSLDTSRSVSTGGGVIILGTETIHEEVFGDLGTVFFRREANIFIITNADRCCVTYPSQSSQLPVQPIDHKRSDRCGKYICPFR